MINPVLVEVTRGPFVESCHCGAVRVFDASGGRRIAISDIDHLIFSRSAVKMIQALPLLEGGTADAFGS